MVTSAKVTLGIGLAFFLGSGVVAMLESGHDAGPAATQAARTTPAVPTPAQTAKAAQCRKVLAQDSSGIWKHYDFSGTTATVIVGPVYYLADFDTKSALNQLVVCVGTKGRMDRSIDFVDYLDSRTHKQAAAWTADYGLDVKE